MNLKPRCKRRHGLALESAIIFMIVILSLSTLLITVIMNGRTKNRMVEARLFEYAAVEQIGEDYLTALKAGKPLEKSYEKYAYTVEGNTLSVWRKTDSNQKTILIVEAEYTAGDVHVISWHNTLRAPKT